MKKLSSPYVQSFLIYLILFLPFFESFLPAHLLYSQDFSHLHDYSGLHVYLFGVNFPTCTFIPTCMIIRDTRVHVNKWLMESLPIFSSHLIMSCICIVWSQLQKNKRWCWATAVEKVSDWYIKTFLTQGFTILINYLHQYLVTIRSSWYH